MIRRQWMWVRIWWARQAVAYARWVAGEYEMHEAGRKCCREKVPHVRVLQDGSQSRVLAQRTDHIPLEMRVPTMADVPVAIVGVPLGSAPHFDRPLYQLASVKAVYRRVQEAEGQRRQHG